MQLEEFALKIGLSKEILILLLIQAAITAVMITLGIGIGEKNGKVPL
ncbi:MAG: hypothetical protein LZ172_01930 [Thaumarchaeota archaeon]|jgi:hypothetical protein|nr:hypothetical protein [Candidatus Geocrenenecus arthurdayi]MCL7403097.1 hypothetical protein [Candidatus Geocrenenecus arthurdayi]